VFCTRSSHWSFCLEGLRRSEQMELSTVVHDVIDPTQHRTCCLLCCWHGAEPLAKRLSTAWQAALHRAASEACAEVSLVVKCGCHSQALAQAARSASTAASSGRVALDDALVTAKLVSHVLFVVIAEDVLTKGLVRETCLNMFCIYLLTHALALLCSCLQTLTLFGRSRSRTCHNSERVAQLARNEAL